jgi:hypothetical protein
MTPCTRTSLKIAMALALLAGFTFAGPAAEAATGCYGHVAYVTPLEYECDGKCHTNYVAGMPTGCTNEQPGALA